MPVHTTFNSSANAAISVAAVDERLSESRIKEVSKMLLETKLKIEAEIKQLLE
ncbi:MAG: hypothetical protein ACREXO_21030 [Advenella sp.]